MGLRFRRSVKICKGVKINFNKKSFGMSIGGKGYGYSLNSSGRQTNRIGIPGTGLSYVNSSSSSSKKNYSKPQTKVVQTTIRMHMDDEGKMTYFYSNGQEITDTSVINKIKRSPEYKLEKDRMQKEHNQEILDKVIEYNKTNNELININKYCVEKIYNKQDYIDKLNNLKIEKYEKKKFDTIMPTKDNTKLDLYEMAKKEIKGIDFWNLKKKRDAYVEDNYEKFYNKKYTKWLSDKEEFEKKEQALEKENNEKYQQEFINNKEYLEGIISGNEQFICNDIDLWFSELEMPLECNINYDYFKEKKLLLLDLDLPEIEDFPNQKAVQLASGNMKLQNKSQTELYNDYKSYVFGLAIFLVGHIFNISPNINNIIISGYTQRRDKKGIINDVYVYSIKFDREKLGQHNLIEGDSYNICMNFENRCNIGVNNLLKEIVPYTEE